MKIYFNPAIKSYSNNRQHDNKHEDNKISAGSNFSYNPIGYRDYNISFGARLFRSPENFYEQDFNKEGMPKTLHRYIYNPDNYGFRKTIPPAQAMKEVFGKISDMQSLEEVKAAFPDEPLFKDLHSQSSRKARTGLLGELALVRADEDYANKSLFKNGKDDLGMYILKKIYVEGKTLKEINKDFHRDKSVVYKGLSDIQYVDIKAFGIHFPRQDFWKSFIATREDFPYVYIPRIVDGGKAPAGLTTHRENVVKQPPKKRFEDLKDWEIDKITDAMLEGMGDRKETEKLLKKRNLKDTESLNFVAKYMGEINSVVLEKLHVSEEMKEFFDNYETLTKSQKQKFKDYWKNPETRELRSLVMSSTIRFFFDVYGVDGNNDEFQELLEYARGIKAKREAQELEHNRRQAEYDELFKSLEEQKSEESVVEKSEPTQEEILPFADELRKQADKLNGKLYDFFVDDGIKVSIVANLSEIMSDKYHEEYKFLPSSFADRYIRFVLKHPKVTEDYMLSLLYKVDDLLSKGEMFANRNFFDDEEKNDELNRMVAEQIKEQLMPADEVKAISKEVYSDFVKNNRKIAAIATQTCMELFMRLANSGDSIQTVTIPKNLMELIDSEADVDINLQEILDKNIQNLIQSRALKKSRLFRKHDIAFIEPHHIIDALKVTGFDELSFEDNKFVEETMEKYQAPLSKKEIRNITNKIIDNLINYDTETSSVLRVPYSFVYKAIQANIAKYPEIKSSLSQILQKEFVVPENTTLRYFIDDNANKKLIEAKTERFIVEFMEKETEVFNFMAAIDIDNINKYVRPYDYSLYYKLCEYRLAAAHYFGKNL